MSYIGIDFGMQNLKVGYFDVERERYSKVDIDGNMGSITKATKNAVYYAENEDGKLNKFFFIANEAENARKLNDPDYVRYIKRELQKEHSEREICGGKYVFSSLEIITDIFRQVALKIDEARFDIKAPVVLTVPVIFSEMQKNKLKYCAECAGFTVQEVITEPFAALFSESIYDECIDIDDEESYTLIFDFGASTLDICLTKISNKDEKINIEVMASTGMSYGGKDITDIIAEFLTSKYRDVIDKNIEAGKTDEEWIVSEMFELAEEMKNELYQDEDIPETENLLFGTKTVLKRVNVDDALDKSGIWDKIKGKIEDMFDSLDEPIDMSDVSKLVTTGGTSKIQYFSDKLEEMFCNADMIVDIYDDDDTIYCAVSSGAVNYVMHDDITVKNSSAMTVGIEHGKGFETALKRNSFYGVKGKRKLLKREWLEENEWKIKVYQTLRGGIKEHSAVNAEDILYAGYIWLNKELYSESEEDIYVSLYAANDGICAETYLKSDIKQPIETDIKLTTEVSL